MPEPESERQRGVVIEVTELPKRRMLGQHYSINGNKVTFPYGHYSNPPLMGPVIRLDDRQPPERCGILAGGTRYIKEITDLQGTVLWRNWYLCPNCRSLNTARMGEEQRRCGDCGQVYPNPHTINPETPD